jgi:hypothetical protein
MMRCMHQLHPERKTISLLDNKAMMIEFLSELGHSKITFLQKNVDALGKKLYQH